MRENFSNLSNRIGIDEGYIDPIAFKSIPEMSDPVLSHYTGHVYDREDIERWIALRGTDPIDRDKILTNEMLVSGRFFKQFYEETNTKFNKSYDKLKQELRLEFSNDIRELREESKRSQFMMQNIININYGLKIQNNQLTQENSELREENTKLRENYVNPIWNKFGPDIDAKLKKGSVPERKKALESYASNIRKSFTDEKLKEAVNNIQSLKDPKISTPRFFAFLVGKSETTKVAEKFQKEVSDYKGWNTIK